MFGGETWSWFVEMRVSSARVFLEIKEERLHKIIKSVCMSVWSWPSWLVREGQSSSSPIMRRRWVTSLSWAGISERLTHRKVINTVLRLDAVQWLSFLIKMIITQQTEASSHSFYFMDDQQLMIIHPSSIMLVTLLDLYLLQQYNHVAFCSSI